MADVRSPRHESEPDELPGVLPETLSEPAADRSAHLGFPGPDFSRLSWWWGLGAIALVGAIVRFWQLGHLNTLVFDEVYFAQFARDYLVGKPVEDGHPPLSKYLIAIGIAISEHFQWGRDITNQATGTRLATISYRWLNAVVGSLLPLVVAWLAWLVSGRRRLALIAGGAIALDGLFVVESRYGLNNVYLVIFGLLGHCCWLQAARILTGRSAWRRWGWLALAGVFFGCTASVKWNGLAFLAGAWGTWGWWRLQSWLAGLSRSRVSAPTDSPVLPADAERSRAIDLPLAHLQRFSVTQMGLMLGLLPLVIYWLLWIPHAQMNPGKSIWEFNQDLLKYHHRVGGDDAHPYCSRWFTWPLLLRPIAYFYARTAPNTPIDYAKPVAQLPASIAPTVYDVHALGNPLLWWLAVVALGAAACWWGRQLWRSMGQPAALAGPFVESRELTTPVVTIGARRWQLRLLWDRAITPLDRPWRSPSMWAVTYGFINYAANWLPWAKVSRCTFLYHYMGAFVFSVVILAWVLDRLWSHRPDRPFAVIALGAIVLSFLFWLPVYLGWPISTLDWQLRIWGIEDVRWLPYWI